mmetsp:Transcript_18352/g.39978  ORF Transcript_18352/g.39978 Transcript_18352/m.39978 type:complete len:83 (+) Transcript_18352:48-296(+)
MYNCERIELQNCSNFFIHDYYPERSNVQRGNPASSRSGRTKLPNAKFPKELPRASLDESENENQSPMSEATSVSLLLPVFST